mmetsp:Transcript_28618/g.75183  ORF Transcript_28618/g.75183 Transcript_28618/m.75183 type:complete len:201 (-) Transcript_28618:960-1562(-)
MCLSRGLCFYRSQPTGLGSEDTALNRDERLDDVRKARTVRLAPGPAPLHQVREPLVALDVQPLFGVRRPLACHDAVTQFAVLLVVQMGPRHLAGVHLPHDDAKGVHVRLLRHLEPTVRLWRQPCQSTSVFLAEPSPYIANLSKVGNLDCAELGYEEVGRLQVAMDTPHRMDVQHPRCCIFAHLDPVFPAQLLLAAEKFSE